MFRPGLFFVVLLLLVGTQVIYSQEEVSPDSVDGMDASGAVRATFVVVDQKYHSEIKEWLQQQDTSLQTKFIAGIVFEIDPADSSQRNLAVIILGDDNQPEKMTFPVDNEFYLKFSEVEERDISVPAAVSETFPESTTTTTKTSGHPQDGRLYFMINTTARSAYLYPFGIMSTWRDADPQVTAGLSLLSIGAYLYGSYAFSHCFSLKRKTTVNGINKQAKPHFIDFSKPMPTIMIWLIHAMPAPIKTTGKPDNSAKKLNL